MAEFVFHRIEAGSRDRQQQTAFGRKNCLFGWSEGGAVALANINPFVGSCYLQGIDPWVYLRHIPDRLQDHPTTRIDEFTPKGATRSGTSH
jgi:hypothetical protein